MGDPLGGATDATSFTSYPAQLVGGGIFKPRFTWDAAPTVADFEEQGIIPVRVFDGTVDEADSPDHAHWSRASGAFSIGLWVRPSSGSATDAFLSKFDTANDTREWVFNRGAGAIRMVLVDESVSGNPEISAVADSALTPDVWTFIVATIDGTADASGISLYQDGQVVASTYADDANFVALEDLGGTVKLAHLNATPAQVYAGRMAGGPLGPFFTHKELSADEVLRLYELGKEALALP